MHFRGFTKPLIFLTKKSIDSISTKTEDGNVRLDNPFVDKNFLFNSEEDLEQIAIEPRFYKKYLDSGHSLRCRCISCSLWGISKKCQESLYVRARRR
jgi:hypothetical protein